MLCRCPKLTPLQSRLLASTATLILLALIYWSLSTPHFAYAAELDIDGSGKSRSGQDHNWHRIGELDLEGRETDDAYMEDASDIDRRVMQETQFQGNNVGTKLNAEPGNSTLWEFPNTLLLGNHTDIGPGLPGALAGERIILSPHPELRKRDIDDTLQTRQASRTIYFSANTCIQPTWNGTGTQPGPPPQLTLYVSNIPGHQNIGPNGNPDQQKVLPFELGFVNVSIPDASGSWYVAVSAPSLPPNYVGFWNYEIAASIDGFYHAADPSERLLFLVDTDLDSALLVTDNLTQADAASPVYQKWVNLTAPFIVFANNANISSVDGLQNSFCGLQTVTQDYDQIQASQSDLEGDATHVQMGMITRGLGNKPKQQFYITNLNSSSSYQAFLAMNGNSTAAGDGVVGGGGKVWAPVPLQTKQDGNCQLLFNLSFCDEVAYAAPSNPNTMPAFENLQQFYDNYTYTWWQAFNYSLAQIPCNTSASSQYSLATNCTKCAASYKEWLCAVSIPRCEDFSNPAPYLQIRNVGQPFYNNDSMLDTDFLLSNFQPMHNAPTVQGSNAFEQTFNWTFATNRSRNPQIDTVIRPGPYKEVLPCEDLCYSLMQDCHAGLGFNCPYRGRGLEVGYGQRNSSGNITCSYLGAVYYLNQAGRTVDSPLPKVLAFAVLVVVYLWTN